MKPFHQMTYQEKLASLVVLQRGIHQILGNDMAIFLFMLDPTGCIDMFTSILELLAKQMDIMKQALKENKLATNNKQLSDNWMEGLIQAIEQDQKRDSSYLECPAEPSIPRYKSLFSIKLSPMNVLYCAKRINPRDSKLVFVRDLKTIPVGIN